MVQQKHISTSGQRWLISFTAISSKRNNKHILVEHNSVLIIGTWIAKSLACRTIQHHQGEQKAVAGNDR